ncbi:hypothetical protein NG895_22600 [Aeoliella sp. ICT_H6.2]|uniref:Uncharacterized protein n=1 Tax=Aeoliella straminimaris TaxID=2954799 RepID=A0A9X2FJ47_9BACT|nr:hypothetical protein [Aeoliella straminimaris]MCO6046696.1 hypothetical protein [Aeoliella straminimaris]
MIPRVTAANAPQPITKTTVTRTVGVGDGNPLKAAISVATITIGHTAAAIKLHQRNGLFVGFCASSGGR